MSRLLRMCFDWRVLGGLAIVGLGLWLYAPQLLGAALPILVVLICPLSMVLMAWMMRGSMGNAAVGHGSTRGARAAAGATQCRDRAHPC